MTLSGPSGTKPMREAMVAVADAGTAAPARGGMVVVGNAPGASDDAAQARPNGGAVAPWHPPGMAGRVRQR